MKFLRWLPLVVTLTAVFVSVMFMNVFLFPELESEMVDILIERSRFLIDTVHQFTSRIESTGRSNNMSEEEVIEIARNVLRNIEYGRGGYFWVITPEGVIVVHPHHSKYEGMSFQEIDDEKLRENFEKAIGSILNALKSGRDTAEYMWYNYETGQLEKKISVFRYFKPWNWIMGTGVYEKDIRDLMNRERSSIERFLILFVSIVLIIAFAVEHSLSKFEKERERFWNEMMLERSRLSTLMENLPVPVAMKDRDLEYVYVNSSFSSFCGRNSDEIIGRVDHEIFSKDLKYHMERFDVEVLKSGSTKVYEFLWKSSGKEKWFSCKKIPITGPEGSVEGILCVLSEITGYKEEIRKLKESAEKDPLTGLMNRGVLESGELIRRFAGSSFALIMLDLDGFKVVNDTHGHAVGDEILRLTAKRIENAVRKDTVVIRYGGDEFLLVSPVGTLEDVEVMVKRILNELREPMRLEDLVLTLSASAGISIYPLNGTDLKELIEKADEALYRAKKLGKGVFVFYGVVE